MLRTEELRKRIKFVDEYLMEEYKRTHPEKERDWRTYEQRLAYRIKTAIRNIEPLVDEAVKIDVHRERGRESELELKQKVLLLLIKELFDRSNRNMAFMIDLFSLLSGIDVSYKTIERLYSDEEVDMALHNLHILILRKKGVQNVNATGDGTGYSLTIRKHYATVVEKKKDKAKDADTANDAKKEEKSRRTFVYSFKMLDLRTWLYVAFGTSMKSEKQAHDRAQAMIKEIGIVLDSVRLDKYYSSPTVVDNYGETVVYILPKSNASVRGSLKWKKTMEAYVDQTLTYLEQYYKREHSESAFSQDKRWFGWEVAQKRDDRIDTAITCANLWHNMVNFGKI